MSISSKIDAKSITKPIQLLAAYLIGLFAINAEFLTCAAYLNESWERDALIISAVVMVPVFLAVLVLLQTVFRNEIQEDKYYAEYWNKKNERKLLPVLETEMPAKSSVVELSSYRETSKAYEAIDGEQVEIALNALHPESSRIKTALNNAGFNVCTAFGGLGDKLPKKWLVSINESISFKVKKKILETLVGFQIDGFSFWQPMRDAEENEDVYVGSYGKAVYAPFSEEFMKLLQEGMDSYDLGAFIAKNRVIG